MRRKYSWPVLVIGSAFLISLALLGEGRLWGQKAGAGSLVASGADSYVFRLELQYGLEQDFTECLGLGSSNDIEETTGIVEPGIVFTAKAPGTLHWQNITLRRDSPSDPDLWYWRRATENLNLEMAIQDGSITMLTAGSAEPVAEWKFRNGWAARLTFSGSREELVIVHEGLERTGMGGVMPPFRR